YISRRLRNDRFKRIVAVLQNLVGGRLGRLNGRNRVGRVVIVFDDGGGLGLEHIGGHMHVLDGLPAGRIVLGDRQNDGAAVVHSDGLADGGVSVSRFAYELSALGIEQSARRYLRGSRGTAIHEYDQRQLRDRPGRRSRMVLARGFLTLRVGDQTFVHE